MVGNQVFNDATAGVFGAVAHTMREYLGVTVPVLGWLRSSTAIHDSVNSRRPLALEPHTKDGIAFRNLARAVLASLPPSDRDLGIVEEVAGDKPSAA
jgi:hypothetical protein